ncbi:N-acyl amino acid synthase FeeM domain-containing protein [Nitrosomonas eutropha]|uniref:N-acyl amino acid synthase FeeM catalytic core domain-containing protein n=2 Tax=Nitrosomonas eutropha TaxID=916 RepID=A0ABX5M6X2_9PROT|nr:hypothetical protein [Nitrosomonas eutropha]ABI58910.1 putative long-chain N-acyl amino acid synthase [Nitrosomonas eutropha C91]PXV77257.1 hypothetical protein C8R14_1308 [Nitrosomonas eutropha]SEI83268.1 hypothetical protein SAMN05216318_11269 [Nitrosomonas eutropha]
MQTANQSTPAVTAKNIQLANLAFNFHHPDSPSFNYSRTQPLPPQQYRIPASPSNYPDHTEPDCLLQRNDYSIHLVNSLKQRIKASTLIKRMYASRGYQTEKTSVFSADSNQYTLEARQSGQLIGTLTLTIDTGKGLLADILYQTELDQLRQQGRKLFEVSKLAFDPESSSKEIFASMFHMAHILAHHIHKADDAVIEINPRHSLFYKRKLGFHQIGELRTCPRVNAPAVLLHLDMNYMKRQILNLGGQTERKEKSLYPYFLTQHEEKIIVQQLQFRQINLNNLHKIRHKWPQLQIGLHA